MFIHVLLTMYQGENSMIKVKVQLKTGQVAVRTFITVLAAAVDLMGISPFANSAQSQNDENTLT